MAVIDVNNLTFGYDGSSENIFENVSFRIDTSWRLGFTGRNGRGKTTFLKLLTGEYEYGGKISANVLFKLFPVEIKDTELFSIDILKSLAGESEEWELIREINLLGVDENVLYRPFSTLSFGERTKIMLAAMFTEENSFPLIDEPTNHLDEEARIILGKYLAKKSGFILVSHDRQLLDTCTDHTLSINRANIEITGGSFSVWYENFSARENFEREQNEKLRKDISRLEKAAKKAQDWSDKAESRKIGFDPTKVEKSASRRVAEGAKAKKQAARSTAIYERRERAAAEKSKLLKNTEISDDLKITPRKTRSGRIISLENISVSYDGRKIFDDLSFDINSGEAVALCGRNGCGKSSIIKLIMSEENISHSGRIYKNSGMIISYVSQDSSDLSGDLGKYAKDLNIDESIFKAILRKLGFERSFFERRSESYSEGQKRKVMLAGSLCQSADLYIWDEPLNFIDLLSRIQIEELLKKFRPTLLLVEHDSVFRKNIGARDIYITK